MTELQSLIDRTCETEELSRCPTFSSYSSDRLADVASRVTDELRIEKFSDLREEDENNFHPEEDDDDFEFSVVRQDQEIFYDGLTRPGPIFPVFNRDLLVDNRDSGGGHREIGRLSDDVQNEIGIPLGKLLLEERDFHDPTSSSSEEDDELESVPQGTYCVWKPKVSESPYRCKKSNSTGSGSKRWKILDLLRRSNSDGKDCYVFLTPKHKEEKLLEKHERSNYAKQISNGAAKVTGKLKPKKSTATAASLSSSAHEAFYIRNRAMEKKKSYLPYRQELVGFFANVNGLSRNFTPF